MRKVDFISILQKLGGFQNYDAQKEQYPIDAVAASDILYMVGFETCELFERWVIDIGCGPGRLIIGAAILGASACVGIDVDLTALQTCRRNSIETEISPIVHVLMADVANPPLRSLLSSELSERTVIMNPPFGKQARHADRQFLETSFAISKNVYSLHLSHPKTRLFLAQFAEDRGFFVDAIFEYQLILEHTQEFHRQKRKKIYADLYHFVKKRQIEKEK